MGLRIATNIQSMSAQRALSGNKTNQDRSLDRLASGARINRAADDAAGLAISEKLRSNLRSMKQAERNANDGISLIQVAEGGLNEINNMLTRVRELSIQAASDTIGDVERGFVDKEVQHLKSEVQRISDTTEYNGTKLLNGSIEEPLDIQVGINNNPTLDRLQFDTAKLKTSIESLGLGDVATMTKEQAQNNFAFLDSAMQLVNENRASLGALQNRMNSTITNLTTYQENLSAARSRISDTDMAEETSNLVKHNILTQANIAVLGQANGNAKQALQLLG